MAITIPSPLQGVLRTALQEEQHISGCKLFATFEQISEQNQCV